MKKKITATKAVTTSVLVSFFDVSINIILAYISGSVVMLSQALEGGADLLAASLLLIGIKRSNLPTDKKHPFGHGRELYFWTFLSALATFTITASISFYFGLKRLLNPKPIENIELAIIALVFATFSNGYSMTLSMKRLIGKRSLKDLWNVFTNSAFIETKTTLVIDMMGTIASVLGLISLTFYLITGNFRFDGLGAMAIGLTLATLALFIIEGARDLLVGQSASPKVEKKIIKVAENFPDVKSVIDLRTLHIGTGKLLVNIEVHLSDELNTDEIEKLIDKIEKEIQKEVPSATNIQIELETPDIKK
jgi:cation diffusion facilitator family transporter